MNKSKYTRPPKEQRPLLSDGVYKAKIKSVSVNDEEDPFNGGQLHKVVVMSMEVTDDNGVALNFWYRVNFSWHEKSNMYKMLNTLNMLPDEDEEIDFLELVNKDVRVLVMNSTKDGITYSNIKQILPPIITRTVTPVVADDDSNDDDELGYDDE